MGLSCTGGLAFRLCLVIAVGVYCLIPAAHAAEARRGAIIERVANASEPARAGLQSGDLVTGWASAGGARGLIESPFDLTETGIEQAPRGAVTLHGLRGGAARSWRINPSTPIWRVDARPVLPEAILASYEGAQALAASDPAGGSDKVRLLADQVDPSAPPWLAAWILYRAAEMAQEARKFDSANELYRLAVSRAGNAAPYIRALILASWAQSLYGRDWVKAAEYMAQSQAEYRKIRTASLGVALVTYSRGEIEKLRERFVEAEPLYQEALAISQKIAPRTLAVAYYLNNAGSLALSRNQLIKADDYFRRALELRRRIAPDSVYTLLNNLGSLAYSQKDLTGAANYYAQALSLLEKIDPQSRRQTTILQNLATLSVERGDLDKAAGYLERALALVQKSAPNTLEEAYFLAYLGGILLNRGDVAGAEKRQQRAFEIRSELAPDSLVCARSLTNLGTTAAARGEDDKAEQYHRRALAIRQKLAPNSSDHADSLLRIGAALQFQGRPAEAVKWFAEGLEMLERAAIESTDEPISESRARFVANYRDYIDLLIDQKRTEEAFLGVERSRARAFLAMLAERPNSLSTGISAALHEARLANSHNYDRIQDELLALSPGRDAARIESLTGRLRALDIEREQIAAEIRKENPRLAAVRYPRPLSLAEARQSLDLGTHLLTYSVGERRTVLFAIAPAGTEPGFSVHVLPTGDKDLQSRAENFRRLLQDRSSDRTALAAAARELYDLLLKPAEVQFARAERLVIAPDGPLHGIPFAALRRNDDQYLVEWKPLHTVLSATVYAELKKASRGSTVEPLQLLALGDPRMPTPVPGSRGPASLPATERGMSFGRLPFSRDEVTGIARLYPDASRVFLQDQATEERAKETMPQARTIHFATHAILDERLPVNAALVLSIPAKRVDGQENGLLQAWEIFDQVRLNADLVVLSACQTGLGKELRGEGLIGLTRAFQYAGAHSVIASLWSVDDRRTADLMRLFYSALRGGASKDVALQQAQREMIRSNASHPFYWAAFTLNGDWR